MGKFFCSKINFNIDLCCKFGLNFLGYDLNKMGRY